MRYQFREKLSSNDIRRIKYAEEIEKNLYNMHDSEWLSEDLNSFEEIFWEKFNGNPRSISPINAMKQMIAFTDFGMAIYEKVKNRILVENI